MVIRRQVNPGLVNAGGNKWQKAAKIAIFRVFAYENGFLKVR
jgi:hypothetical protein